MTRKTDLQESISTLRPILKAFINIEKETESEIIPVDLTNIAQKIKKLHDSI